MDLALIWLHVTANLVWIGSILAVTRVIQSASADAKTRGALALDIYKKLAVPAFVVSFVCGAARLGMDPALYFKQSHWMHAKLPLALGVIGLHHVIGARAKKLSLGTVQDGGPAAILGAVIAVLAMGAAFFAVFKVPH
ncbi:MAG: CopD family protein [Byssovorax sp.]